jgi:dGTPase
VNVPAASEVDFSYQRREEAILAPYAMHGRDSAGREHAEAEQPYRGPFQRDRDRILHSAAFRRLSGKTQVFTGTRGDYHRTRLTHTMEVASISRTIGRALRLNEDLIEALALLHDIGHPPFGHAGEDALNAFLADEGGFSHNQYALTLVEEIERPYPTFPGLNLTREVLEGQRSRVTKSTTGLPPPLEVQVVDIADSITYDAHDTDDAVKLGWLEMDQLAELPLIQSCMATVHDHFGSVAPRLLRRAVVHELINCQVQDILATAGRAIRAASWGNASQARQSLFRLGASPTLHARKEQLERFLYQHVYRHPDLVRARESAQALLLKLVGKYERDPEQLPESFRQRSDTVGLRRSVVDYVAGMTDRYCLDRCRG